MCVNLSCVNLSLCKSGFCVNVENVNLGQRLEGEQLGTHGCFWQKLKRGRAAAAAAGCKVVRNQGDLAWSRSRGSQRSKKTIKLQ